MSDLEASIRKHRGDLWAVKRELDYSGIYGLKHEIATRGLQGLVREVSAGVVHLHCAVCGNTVCGHPRPPSRPPLASSGRHAADRLEVAKRGHEFVGSNGRSVRLRVDGSSVIEIPRVIWDLIVAGRL